MRTLLYALFLAAAASAQSQTFTVPPLTLPHANTNLPISAGIGRYQQWYAASDLQAALTQPMRFERLQLLAGSGQTTNSTTIDAEVAIGHGFTGGLTGQFESNFLQPKTIVFPRGTLALNAGTAGQVVLTVNFSTFFTWDGQSPIVIDIRVFGNGRGNASFNYDFLCTLAGPLHVSRAYAANNANATSGSPLLSSGLFTNFTARPGVVLPFGNGCPGSFFVTPVASVSGIPQPASAWQHQVGQAAPQQLALLALGLSNTTSGLGPLPFDLGPVIGANGCFLLVDPFATTFANTVGGPSAGIASIVIQIPPFNGFVGTSIYSQWFVADPGAVNGVLSATGGIWSIVKAIGT
jgi:hypothetical protein